MNRKILVTRLNNFTVSPLLSVFIKYPLKTVSLSLALLPLFFPQSVYADLQVEAFKQNQDKLIVYSAPSSSEKTGAVPVQQINLPLIVSEEAMNGRFLKVEINGKQQWIKAKQVKTNQTYDLGSCEKQGDNVTGTRGAVNCTK